MYKKIYDIPIPAEGDLPFQLPGWIACAPFEEFLGMRIDEVGEGRAVLTMPFKVKLAQGKGFMHGGAITALADTAVAIAIKSVLPEGTNFVTMELGLKFHAPIRYGVVKAEARIIDQNDRDIRGVAEIFDERGLKVATFTSVFRVRRR